jgi:hypothetical protein
MDEEIESEEKEALGITEQIERDVTREPDELSSSVEPEEEVEQEEEEQEAIVEEQETDVIAQEVDTTSSEDDEEEEDHKPQRRSWKKDYLQMEKRFNNYKGSTDSTIYSLRQELASTKEQLNEALTAFSQLQKQSLENTKLGQNDYSEHLSDEEKEHLDDLGVSGVSKIVDSVISRYEQQNQERFNRFEQERIRQNQQNAQSLQQQNYQRFLERLGEKVPDYMQMVQHQDWSTFGQETDPINGTLIIEEFQAAEKRGDLRKVVDYFNMFKERVSPSKKLDENLSPTGKGGGSTTQQSAVPREQGPVMLSLKRIDKFYDDLVKGRYKGQEQLVKDMEFEIESAEADGRILDDRDRPWNQ